MPELFIRFPINTIGRDFAVGDIHGHFSRLQTVLDHVGFDPESDRLFSVGDLVDRGPESARVVDWLAKPWFHAVRGNHEDYVCRYQTVDRDNWIINGGSWFLSLPQPEQDALSHLMLSLPIAIEVETPQGPVGIVHADVPCLQWAALPELLRSKRARSICMWSRDRIRSENESGVGGVRAVIVGHQPLSQPVVLNNVYHIDTRGWLPEEGGYFTLLDLHTLKANPPLPGTPA